MDENEEEITQKKSVTKRKTKTQKDALPPRPKYVQLAHFRANFVKDTDSDCNVDKRAKDLSIQTMKMRRKLSLSKRRKKRRSLQPSDLNWKRMERERKIGK